MSDEQAEIKKYVRERYGERARQAAQLVEEVSCCGGATCSTDTGTSVEALRKTLESDFLTYRQSELEGLPVEAVAASAGCGNPTALAGLKVGERVLDLGSGGGIDCFLAARQVGPRGHVTGLDMTPDMLALARKNAATLGLSNVEFVQGEMEDIPLPDASVDVVISNCVVCLSPDKEAVARETYRVLAPGGRLHISDMMALGPMPKELRDDPQKWASCVSGADDRETYLSRLSGAGFSDIAITPEGPVHAREEGSPGVVSVKVVAYKPVECGCC